MNKPLATCLAVITNLKGLMIIDLILDRKDNDNYRKLAKKHQKRDIKDTYNREAFIYGIKGYCDGINNDNDNLLEFIKDNDLNDYRIKKALSTYIIDCGYNLNIIKYILSVKW